MAGEIVGGRAAKQQVPLNVVRSGAVTQDVPFLLDPTNDSRYRDSMHGGGFAFVQVTSPINAGGAADLDIRAGSQTFFLAGGGNTLTIVGPVWSVQATPRGAAVSGVGADQITFAPIGRR